MGTHPIFESDFDCLTDRNSDFVKKCLILAIMLRLPTTWPTIGQKRPRAPKCPPSSSLAAGRPTTLRSTTFPSPTILACEDRYAKFLPHTSGRYQVKRFHKAQCPIVERLVNSLMMHGRNNGKKLMTVRIVKHAFEIIHLTSGENPIQILLQAIINSGPREDSTRIGRAGTVRRQAVDVSPLRRVNQAIWLLCTGA